MLDTMSSVHLTLRSNARSFSGVLNPMTLVFDSLDLGGLICMSICLIDSIIVLASNDERFCFPTMSYRLHLHPSATFSYIHIGLLSL